MAEADVLVGEPGTRGGATRPCVLELEDLVVAYGGIHAVRDLSLTVAEGEVVALLGPNGAGKSSTLNAIVGMAPTIAGRIMLDGNDITTTATEDVVRMGVAQVPEGRQVFEQLTVAENLVVGGVGRRDGGGGARIERDELLDLFPILRERADQSAGTLSGGEQQQLAIARALMSSPRVVLLDEPSLGLAPRVTQRIFGLIAGLRSRGLTMLLVEQNVELALRNSDRAYVLASGELRLSGSSAELRERTDLERTYLGLSGG